MTEISLIATLNNKFTSPHLRIPLFGITTSDDGSIYVLTLTDRARLKLVHNGCVIEVFDGVFVMSLDFFIF